MKALVILTPPAERAAHESLLETLNRHFTASRIDYEVHETLKTDKPNEIVRARLGEGFDLVVAAGGDGTVSSVSDGLAGSSVPLGIIPTGTGNLFARELEIPLEIDAAVALFAGAPRSRRTDAMRINKRMYILNASVGISATVIGSTTRKNKGRFGRIAYIGTGLLKLVKFKLLKPRHLIVTVDGKAQEFRAVEVAVTNCGMLGKMLYPKGPNICVDDGHLDVWILSMQTFLDYPRYLFDLVSGRPTHLHAHFIKAHKSISIRSTVRLAVQADGDIIGTSPVEIEVLQGSLTVLVPEKPVPVPSQDGLAES